MAFFLSNDIIQLLLSCDGGTCGRARRDYSMKRTEEHWELELITDRKMSKNANFSRISTCQWVK